MSAYEFCYEISATESKGNILIALRDIKKGEEPIINNEKPLIWNQLQNKSKGCHPNCSSCGTIIGSQLFDLIRKDLTTADSETKSQFIMEILTETISNLKVSPTSNNLIPPISCINNCGAIYCCKECETTSELNGHLWICKDSYQQIEQLNKLDSRGHFGLALKFYAKIATSIVLEINNNKNPSPEDIDAIAVRNSENILMNYHSVDYTRVKIIILILKFLLLQLLFLLLLLLLL
jgi:hypothetical protein